MFKSFFSLFNSQRANFKQISKSAEEMKIILSYYVYLGLHGVLGIKEYKYHSFTIHNLDIHISLSPVEMMEDGGMEPHTFTSKSDLYQ